MHFLFPFKVRDDPLWKQDGAFFPLAYRAPTYVPGSYEVPYMISFPFHNSLKQLGSIRKCISVRVQADEESHSRYFSRKGVNTEILNIWQGSEGQWEPSLTLKSENTWVTGSPYQWSHLMLSSHVSHWSQGFWKLTCKSLQASCPLYVHVVTPNRQRGVNGSPPLCLPGWHECLALAGSKPELYWPKEPGKCSFHPSSPHKTRKNLKSTDNIQHAAAAAKSLQSCPTPSDPMDCSLPGSSVHGICQARVLEWVAIAFSNIQHREMLLCSSYYWSNWVSRSGITLPKLSPLVCGGNDVWISLNPPDSKIRKNEWILIDVETQIYPSGSWEDISVLGLLIHQPYLHRGDKKASIVSNKSSSALEVYICLLVQVVKNSPANAGDAGDTVSKILWRRKWQPTPVFSSGKLLDREAWQASVHRVTKSHTQPSTHICTEWLGRVWKQN